MESTKQPAIDQGAPLGYIRCYVEDFMTTAVGDSLMILIPEGYSAPIKTDRIALSWTRFIKGNLQRSEHKFTDGVSLGFEVVVKDNVNRDKVTIGYHMDKIDSQGCIISFSPRLSRLLTWWEVLDGRQNGIQVWRKGGQFRSVSKEYRARHKTMQGLKYLTNLLYPEVYGDRMQACHLLDCHHRAVIQQQKTEMTKLRAKRDVDYIKSEHLDQL